MKKFDENTTKYAALKFETYNIGDEIQSIAAQRFLPQIDYYISRDKIKKFHAECKVKLIMNSWYMMGNTRNFPPAECVSPLLVSMHIDNETRKTIMTKKSREFFTKNGPVGCRDYSTLEWFKSLDIDSYFSGCLTSTLVKNQKMKDSQTKKYILCVDCTRKVEQYVRKHSEYPVLSFNKMFNRVFKTEDRMTLAKVVLYMYHNAYCVVTTNLHTAMPCNAFETKACLIEVKKHIVSGRFKGLENCFHYYSEKEFLDGCYDINNPPDNRQEYLTIRKTLEKQCKEFTGFDAGKPTLDDDFEPITALLKALQRDPKQGRYYSKHKFRVRYKDVLTNLLRAEFNRFWEDTKQ